MTFRRDASGKVTGLVYRGRFSPRMPDREPVARPLGEYVGEYFSQELDATYRVELADGALIARHRRHGASALTRRWGEDFAGAQFFLRSVRFERDRGGKVTGFVVNIDERSREIRFGRVR